MSYENLSLYNQWLDYQKKCLTQLVDDVDDLDKEKVSFL
jgi:hypothetical protein